MNHQEHRSKYFLKLADCPKEKVLWPLFLVSFAALYIEVLLIRWIGTEVRVFAYFQNLALIACFLGFGVGCYRAKAKKSFLFDGLALGTLLIMVSLPFAKWKDQLEGMSAQLSFSNDAQLWSSINASAYDAHAALSLSLVSLLVISIFLMLLTLTMVPLGQWVGTYLSAAHEPIRAYSVNLLGSLCGIWFFAGLSFLGLAPVYWFAFAAFLLLLVRPVLRSAKPVWAGALVMTVGLCLIGFGGRGAVYWSPYQKLAVETVGDGYNIQVNNTGYMTIANLTRESLAANPVLAKAYPNSSYDLPFQLTGSRDRVLIVGSGAGNDVDAALRNGAGRVDAVEIDPVIYSLGKRLHPDHPYDSPRARIHINDARAFFRQSPEKFDVIVFGLLDSHTTFSGYSNMRVDSYVYTQESFEEAKRHLKPTGVLIVKFEVRAPSTWMGQRFYAMFEGIFGRPPVTYYVPAMGGLLSATEFVASNDSGAWTRAAKPEFAQMIKNNPAPFPLDVQKAPGPTTDDWPYVYHRDHNIPGIYLTVSLVVLALAAFMARGAFDPRHASTWNFFFLGAGFLLMETQIISRLALYFGATWLVNCIALSIVLAVLVLANLCVQRRWAVGNLWGWYLGLLVSLLAIYFIPWEALPFGTIGIGISLGTAYCVPLFSAGVIFAETFRRCADKSACFGSNILGAVAGGLAQSTSFLFGMKALLLVAGIFYLLAAVCGGLRQPVSAPTRELTARNRIPVEA